MSTLFQQGLFRPDLIPDARVQDVFRRAADDTGGNVRPIDLLAGAVRQGDPSVLAILSQALRPGATLETLRQEMSKRGGPRAPGLRNSVTLAPETLLVLQQFDAVLSTNGETLQGAALELLLHCTLQYLAERELRAPPSLDVAAAAVAFREQIISTVEPSPNGYVRAGGAEGEEQDEQFLLPPALAPSEDLTFRARTAAPCSSYPFDNDPQYDRLFEAVARALHRRQGNHVLLVGERGVGKSTLVAELARRAAAGSIPFLSGKRFLSVDCRYVPADESRARLGAFLSHVLPHPDLVVCLDGLPAMLRGERSADNKAVLKSGLAQARCQFLALLTPREFVELVPDDPDLAESFTTVAVEEPDLDTALKLLRHFVGGLQDRFSVAIDDEAVRQAVALTAAYILNDQLPAKALKILLEVCENLDYDRRQLGSDRDRVTAGDVVRAVSLKSGVPEETLYGVAERTDYEKALKEVIFGQDHVVREVATELGLIKAGMTDPDKPASVLLFLGQTGTGKTEMAKALARFYSTSKRLKVYTLGNCVEPHSVATIIGVPPGYVGHDQGGRLVNDLNTDPYCVFLLDEVDKAHPDVLQPFLNLFDEGWVCDQRGVRAYGDKAIFVLTTNVGQRMIAEMVEQRKTRDEITARMKEALSQIRHSKSERPVFTPEFLARIKRTVVFNPLDLLAMEGICRKLVREMRQTWNTKRGKSLDVEDDLLKYLAEQANRVNEKSKGKEGGRLVRKLIADWVESRLQRAITEDRFAYRDCTGVEVTFRRPTAGTDDLLATVPEILVNFCKKDVSM